eukprot:722213-Amphidinium_carterae.2
MPRFSTDYQLTKIRPPKYGIAFSDLYKGAVFATPESDGIPEKVDCLVCASGMTCKFNPTMPTYVHTHGGDICQ